jgi:hypothetical protein
LPSSSIAIALEPPFPVPFKPVPAVLALGERGDKKGLLPSLLPGIRVSPPHNFATFFLEKIGKVDPIPCPTFQGQRFGRPDVGWFNQK